MYSQQHASQLPDLNEVTISEELESPLRHSKTHKITSRRPFHSPHGTKPEIVVKIIYPRQTIHYGPWKIRDYFFGGKTPYEKFGEKAHLRV